MSSKTSDWIRAFGSAWDLVGIFESKEIKAWKDAKPLQWEARASARMEAYVKNTEIYADKAVEAKLK